jgi:hypothetical protein
VVDHRVHGAWRGLPDLRGATGARADRWPAAAAARHHHDGDTPDVVIEGPPPRAGAGHAPPVASVAGRRVAHRWAVVDSRFRRATRRLCGAFVDAPERGATRAKTTNA